METPVLNKNQKKLSLSGKKNKKEVIKNVLVNPYKTNWPLVQNELNYLSDALKENLSRIKPVKINVPWRLLKDFPKDERNQIRNNYIQTHRPAQNFKRDDKLIFGVNEVTKLLESDSCSAVLVADVIPRTVVKHIVEMAALKNIAVLVVPTLKQMLKNFCGLESMALAIKKDFESSSNLAAIVGIILEINKNYLPSENHINSTRSGRLEDIEKRCDVDEHEQNLEKPIKKEQQVFNHHLVRMVPSQRVFVPELKEISSENLISVEGDKFVCSTPFGIKKSQQDLAHQAIRKKIMKKLYKPLTVKRLKGNKNRQNNKNKLGKNVN